ncbi:hypothetical protein SETIT_4G205700v2 [Setaria italica]|uniref:BTB domain-containing protein n=1 Tax=Setaria italica TaxID=4555 RepID=K3Y206_SETIT|nr:hypothetical protein SETIT_4G205700v2 [Setaria italica]
MIGGRQWRIRFYRTGIHDPWYPPAGPKGISVILVLMNSAQKVRVLFCAVVGDAIDYDGTFRFQDLKELEFRNGNLEHGFNYLVGHHDIERVWDHSSRVNISCTVTVLEDDYIEVLPPSVGRSICTTIVAQASVNVVFDIGGRVIRARWADVAALSRVMVALLYGSGMGSMSKTVSIKDTNPAGFSLLIKYACEGSLPEEVDLWDTPTNAWPLLLSLTDMYCVKRLKLHCASKMWDLACEKIVTTILRWAFDTNCTQLQEKCMSFIALISPDRSVFYHDNPWSAHQCHDATDYPRLPSGADRLRKVTNAWVRVPSGPTC